MTFANLIDIVARAAGHRFTVLGAGMFVLGWALAGLYFGWSEGLLSFINTLTAVITFLLLFIVQNTQNRDTCALQAKMDELIRVTDKARNEFIGIERKVDAEVEELTSEHEDQQS